MPPAGALIFKLEQTFIRVSPDYRELQELIAREGSPGAYQQPGPGSAPAMLALRKRLGRGAYERVRLNAEAAAERVETQALDGAQVYPGTVKLLESLRDTGWWVVASSDLGRKPVAGFLKAKSLAQFFNAVVARPRLDEERLLAKRLRPIKSKLKTLAYSVYFCNSSREVTEAKALGMKCFVLPSPVEPFRTLYQAGPSGILLSLEEVLPLLSLPAMKLPEQPKPAAEKKAVPRRKKRASRTPRRAPNRRKPDGSRPPNG